MGRIDQAAFADAAADQLFLAFRDGRGLVGSRRADRPWLFAAQTGGAELRHRAGGDHQREDASVPRTGIAGGGIHAGRAGAAVDISVLNSMLAILNPEFGEKIVTLTAAMVLVLQIAMAA